MATLLLPTMISQLPREASYIDSDSTYMHLFDTISTLPRSLSTSSESSSASSETTNNSISSSISSSSSYRYNSTSALKFPITPQPSRFDLPTYNQQLLPRHLQDPLTRNYPMSNPGKPLSIEECLARKPLPHTFQGVVNEKLLELEQRRRDGNDIEKEREGERLERRADFERVKRELMNGV